eukprot:gene15443-18318_t
MSEDIVFTACHVVVPDYPVTDDHIVLYYIYFGVAASHIETNPLEEDPERSIYELTLVDGKGRREVDLQVPRSFSRCGTGFTERFNDIAVLRFATSKPSVKWYPGDLQLTQFLEHSATANQEYIATLYKSLKKSYYFDHKIVTVATGAVFHHDQLSTHRCLSNPGTSGGFLGVLGQQSSGFIGIHIGCGDGENYLTLIQTS